MSNVRRHTMFPLESAITPGMKALGFRKKARNWWRTDAYTVQVLNLQKSQFGEQLYVNLAVYLSELGNEISPPHNRCHIQARLERIVDAKYWNEIVTAESATPPSPAFVEAILKGGVAWLDRVSTPDGIRTYLKEGGEKKGLVFGSVRNLVGAQ
jgi:hypothetical protein